MSFKTTCWIFGTILITLQFCHVLCHYEVQTYFSINDDNGQHYPYDIYFQCKIGIYDHSDKDYKCKFQLSDGTFIEYKTKANDEKENVNGTYHYTIHHFKDVYMFPCAIKIYAPFDKLTLRKTWKCWITSYFGTYGDITEISLGKILYQTASTEKSLGNSTFNKITKPTVLQPIISSNKLHVKRGDEFRIGCQIMMPLEKCLLTSPNGTKILIDNNTPLLNDGILSIGDCFTIIKKAEDSHNGNWTCEVLEYIPKTWWPPSSGRIFKTTVPVTLEESNLLISIEKIPETSKTIIKCNAIPTLPSKITECKWKFLGSINILNNWDIKVSYNHTSCVVQLDERRYSYEGKWICNVTFKTDYGSSRLINNRETASIEYYNKILKISNSSLPIPKVGDFEIKVNDTSDKLSFECSRTINIVTDFMCKFQLSDGTFITYKPQKAGGQVKNLAEKYNYTISHPAINDNKKVCKIEIHPPFDNLKLRNAYKCWIITRNQTYGTVLEKQLTKRNVPSTVSPPIISSNKVHVKRGDDFMIGCQVMEPTDKCFLISPNGAVFNVSNELETVIITHENYKLNNDKTNEKSINPIQTLAYNNRFSMGDCFAIISKADNIHAGNWTCQLHLNNTKKDHQTNISVTVEESYLVASYNNNEPPSTISCNAIPTLSSKIIHCKWQLLNRFNPSENNLQNTSTSYNATSCELKFNDWKDFYEGDWICNTTFENEFGDKFNASKIITYSPLTITVPKIDVDMNIIDNRGNLSIKCSQTNDFIVEDFICKFQLSDGTFITYKSQEGGGQVKNLAEKYNYTIIHPAINDNKKVCKIEIYPLFDNLKLKNTYKCWITTWYQTFGTIIEKQLTQRNVPSTVSPPIISSNDIIVKRGDDFMIGCQVMEPISNCSLIGPNNKTFNVLNTESAKIIGHKKYHANGIEDNMLNFIQTKMYYSRFSMGDCFAIISKANNTHAGNWTCQLHLNNNKKAHNTTISVAVKESYLDVKNSTEDNTIKTINCTAISTLSSKLNHCGWTYPNGTNIPENSFSNISIFMNKNSCKLTFNDWLNSYNGNWTCNVQFENVFGYEFNESNYYEFTPLQKALKNPPILSSITTEVQSPISTSLVTTVTPSTTVKAPTSVTPSTTPPSTTTPKSSSTTSSPAWFCMSLLFIFSTLHYVYMSC